MDSDFPEEQDLLDFDLDFSFFRYDSLDLDLELLDADLDFFDPDLELESFLSFDRLLAFSSIMSLINSIFLPFISYPWYLFTTLSRSSMVASSTLPSFLLSVCASA